MKTLIVFFSRSGRTRRLAEEIEGRLGSDIEEIRESKGRGGAIGWLKSGMESTRMMLPKINALERDPGAYDLVLVGTPIWASNMSSPVRAFITEHRDRIQEAAFFCTGDGDDPGKVFGPMEELLGKRPIATMGLIGEERENPDSLKKIEEFVERVSSA
ncbi:MAG: flavodoxin family protein [Candidatus Bathyarchaeota archaeon]|nr:MAG: flavodoxin family protein [Candidatus Bathyarchaeota archaeon]